jgi:CxxC motif-containing protein
VLFEDRKGPVPEGLVLHHRCGNRACCNLDHLEVTDNRTNTLLGNGCFARCARATHCPRGHEYAGENLYVRDGKYRGCRACDRIRGAAAYLRKKEREATGTPAPKRTPKETPVRPSAGTFSGKANTMEHLLSRMSIREDGCWIWTGCVGRKGYGNAKYQGKAGPVHRHVYEHFRGPIPEGLVIDHLCRNPACANPDHLEAVTPRENILRGVGLAAQQVKRTHCPRGHEYSGYNLFYYQGRRFCRECGRIRTRAYILRKQQRES